MDLSSHLLKGSKVIGNGNENVVATTGATLTGTTLKNVQNNLKVWAVSTRLWVFRAAFTPCGIHVSFTDFNVKNLISAHIYFLKTVQKLHIQHLCLI